MAVYGSPGEEVLFHLGAGEAAAIHKYISRKYSNGRWQYTYPSRKTVKKARRANNLRKRKSSYVSEDEKAKNRVVRDVSTDVDMGISDTAIAKRYYRGITRIYDLMKSSPESITANDIKNARSAIWLLEDIDEETSKQYGLGIDFAKINAVRNYINSKEKR